MVKPDSLIFDMDGTLWNATQTYVDAWNEGFRRMNLSKTITYDDLAGVMGWNRRNALAKLLPEYSITTQDDIYKVINEARSEFIPKYGGILYEGVKSGLEKLSRHYKLFIVSNCPEGVIKQFISFTNTEKYITDEMAHGVNLMPKHHNIKLLVEKYNLKDPVYIGDTEIDGEESRLAGIPFIFLSYGFGKTDNFDMKFENFNDFTDYFLSISKTNTKE